MLVLVGTTTVLTCDGLCRANDDGKSGTLEMWIVNNKTYELDEYPKEKHGIFYRCPQPIPFFVCGSHTRSHGGVLV